MVVTVSTRLVTSISVDSAEACREEPTHANNGRLRSEGIADLARGLHKRCADVDGYTSHVLAFRCDGE